MRICGVIFDMDGLMFDTERLSAKAWDEVYAHLGIKRAADLPDMTGMNTHQIKILYRQAYGPNFDYDAARALKTKIMEEYIESHGLPVKPGLYSLLEYLETARIPVALDTSSDRSTALHYLDLSRIRRCFSVIISGDMVQWSKPNPLIFQLAARQLNTLPGETLVLEDSFNGIKAAFDGGFFPCMVPDLRQPTPESIGMIAQLFHSLTDVIPFLEKSVARTPRSNNN